MTAIISTAHDIGAIILLVYATTFLIRAPSMRRWYYITSALLVLMAMSMPAQSERLEGSTPIGVSIVLSGPWESWGIPIRNGLELGASQSKNRIALQFQDDRCEAKRSLTNFQKFLSIDKFSLIILGCMESIEATLPISESRGATVLTMGGMSRDYLRKFPHLISLYTLVDTEAYYLIPYIKDRAKVRRLAIINHSQTYGEYFGAGVEGLASKAGLTVTRRERVDHAESDFRAITTRVLVGKPDAIVVHISAEKEGLLIRQIREQGYSGLIFATFSFEADEVKRSGGAALDGVLYTYPVDASQGAAYEEFRTQYIERFKTEPQATSAIAFDGVQLLDRAITACEKGGRSCVAEYFAQIGTFNGLGGRVIFGPDRSALRPYGLKEFRGGEYRWVERELPQ